VAPISAAAWFDRTRERSCLFSPDADISKIAAIFNPSGRGEGSVRPRSYSRFTGGREGGREAAYSRQRWRRVDGHCFAARFLVFAVLIWRPVRSHCLLHPLITLEAKAWLVSALPAIRRTAPMRFTSTISRTLKGRTWSRGVAAARILPTSNGAHRRRTSTVGPAVPAAGPHGQAYAADFRRPGPQRWFRPWCLAIWARLPALRRARRFLVNPCHRGILETALSRSNEFQRLRGGPSLQSYFYDEFIRPNPTAAVLRSANRDGSG